METLRISRVNQPKGKQFLEFGSAFMLLVAFPLLDFPGLNSDAGSPMESSLHLIKKTLQKYSKRPMFRETIDLSHPPLLSLMSLPDLWKVLSW